MTMEERLANLEIPVRNHDAMFNLLIGISERQQVFLEQVQRDGQKTQALVEQVQRDSQKTQRLWVNLCKKYGWLEDEDLLGG